MWNCIQEAERVWRKRNKKNLKKEFQLKLKEVK